MAFVLAFVFTIGGIVCGHLALAQIRRTGEGGRGLAIAALVIGYGVIGLAVLVFLAAIVLPLMFFGALVVGTAGR